MRCRICDGLPPEHRPYVVWHTGWDGCEEHDRDYYDEGVVVCADCIEALRYAGIGLDGDACVIDLQCSVDMWAQDTLWHAFWTPERVTVCEAECARRYLDRSGNKDVDPAWDWLPNGTWSDVDEFKDDLGSALCRRFLTDDMDGLAAAYLKQGDGWVSTRTQDVWKLAERLAARKRKPERAFVRISGWTADRPNMQIIVDVLQDDGETVRVPLPLTSAYLLVDDAECDDRFQYGWLDVLELLPEHVDYDRLDETGMRVVDWLNGMFCDWANAKETE